jgi:hypothetical protein
MSLLDVCATEIYVPLVKQKSSMMSYPHPFLRLVTSACLKSLQCKLLTLRPPQAAHLRLEGLRSVLLCETSQWIYAHQPIHSLSSARWGRRLDEHLFPWRGA